MIRDHFTSDDWEPGDALEWKTELLPDGSLQVTSVSLIRGGVVFARQEVPLPRLKISSGEFTAEEARAIFG